MAFALIVSGCASQETDYISEEYDQHVSTFEEDVASLDDAIDNWNDALAMAESDGYIGDEEYDHLIDIRNEYSTEMNRVNPHIDSFKAFIEENENALKDMGVDTYEDKKALVDFQTEMDENYEVMETSTNQETDYIADEYEQHLATYEEDLSNIESCTDNWNDALAMAESDGYISDEEYDHLIDVGNEYIDEMNRVEPHLVSFKEFIEENEIALKDMGVDTYEDKKILDDLQTSIDRDYETILISLEG
ncbi:hypothetical protein [Methanococcoides sp. FTZ1]|uniref:hypothetical protein n=1 Tax=Methanococcoides sp. FTZ1 TaxID=3439061 RepID=UPI003F829282